MRSSQNTGLADLRRKQRAIDAIRAASKNSVSASANDHSPRPPPMSSSSKRVSSIRGTNVARAPLAKRSAWETGAPRSVRIVVSAPSAESPSRTCGTIQGSTVGSSRTASRSSIRASRIDGRTSEPPLNATARAPRNRSGNSARASQIRWRAVRNATTMKGPHAARIATATYQRMPASTKSIARNPHAARNAAPGRPFCIARCHAYAAASTATTLSWKYDSFNGWSAQRMEDGDRLKTPMVKSTMPREAPALRAQRNSSHIAPR